VRAMKQGRIPAMTSTEKEPSNSISTVTASNILGSSVSWSDDSILNLNRQHYTNGLPTPQSSTRANAIILDEIADWCTLNARDERPVPGRGRMVKKEEWVGELLPFTDVVDATASTDTLSRIAVQLLASCYTPLQTHATLPSTFYTRRPVSTPPSPQRMQSSLRMHSHYRLSPSSGYHARDTSPAPSWPAVSANQLPEEQLVEESSTVRRRKQCAHVTGTEQNFRVAFDEGMRLPTGRLDHQSSSHQSSRSCQEVGITEIAQGTLEWSGDGTSPEDSDERKEEENNSGDSVNHSGSNVKSRKILVFKNPLRKRDPASASRYETEDVGASSEFSPASSSSSSRQTAVGLNKRKATPIAGQRSHPTKHYPSRTRKQSLRSRRWSFKPVIRSEPHPLFIQPVKDYEIQRYQGSSRGKRKARKTTTAGTGVGAASSSGTRRSATAARSNGTRSRSRTGRATSDPSVATMPLSGPRPPIVRLTSVSNPVAGQWVVSDPDEVISIFDILAAGPIMTKGVVPEHS
jgi:hypothetical protein